MTFSRRSFLAGAGGVSLALTTPAILHAAAPRLALYGPPAGPTITLAHAVEAGRLRDLGGEISLTVWRSPDELRAGLTSGAIDLSVVPAQVAANLYNRGMGMRLVNVMTNGLLYIMARDGALDGMAALAGKTLAVPFPNDTPDFITRALLDHHGLAGKVELLLPATPMEAAQMLLAGRIDAAVLSEPVASAMVLRSSAPAPDVHAAEVAGAQAQKAQEAGAVGGPAIPLVRAIDIQAEWGAVTGLGPVVPQAGLAVTNRFSADHADLIAPLQKVMEDATIAVLADPKAAATQASPHLELPAPILAASIPYANLVATPASQARPALEAMFNLMAGNDAAILGGKLPDDGFYAL